MSGEQRLVLRRATIFKFSKTPVDGATRMTKIIMGTEMKEEVHDISVESARAMYRNLTEKCGYESKDTEDHAFIRRIEEAVFSPEDGKIRVVKTAIGKDRRKIWNFVTSRDVANKRLHELRSALYAERSQQPRIFD